MNEARDAEIIRLLELLLRKIAILEQRATKAEQELQRLGY
jgi:hypothetical protein